MARHTHREYLRLGVLMESPTAEIVILGERATCPYCGHTTGIDFDGDVRGGEVPKMVAVSTATDPCGHLDGVEGDFDHWQRTGETRMIAIFYRDGA